MALSTDEVAALLPHTRRRFGVPDGEQVSVFDVARHGGEQVGRGVARHELQGIHVSLDDAAERQAVPSDIAQQHQSGLRALGFGAQATAPESAWQRREQHAAPTQLVQRRLGPKDLRIHLAHQSGTALTPVGFQTRFWPALGAGLHTASKTRLPRQFASNVEAVLPR
jgi:hypothetical protein